MVKRSRKSKSIIDDSSINTESVDIEKSVDEFIETVNTVVDDKESEIFDKESTSVQELAIDNLSDNDNVTTKSIAEYDKIFNAEYFENMAKNGCDYRINGAWQNAYAGMLKRVLKLTNGSLLDIGGAFGSIGHSLRMIGVHTTNLDASTYLVGKTFKNLRHIHGTAQNLEMFDKDTFDAIHMSYVIEYVPTKELVIMFKEIKRVLKPEGKVLIITNYGDDTFNEDKQEYKHSNKTIISAASEAGLTQVDNIRELMEYYDDKDYQFLKTYNWNILCFE